MTAWAEHTVEVPGTKVHVTRGGKGPTAVVLHRRLWPRALDQARPTAADVQALTMLAREQERVPGQRVDVRVVNVAR